MISYILLLISIILFSTIFHNSWNMFSLKRPDDEERTRSMHDKALKMFWFSLIILIGIVYWGWTLKGNMFLVWSAIIFIISFFVERREFNWKYFQIKGSWDNGIKIFLNSIRIVGVIVFFVWYLYYQ